MPLYLCISRCEFRGERWSPKQMPTFATEVKVPPRFVRIPRPIEEGILAIDAALFYAESDKERAALTGAKFEEPIRERLREKGASKRAWDKHAKELEATKSKGNRSLEKWQRVIRGKQILLEIKLLTGVDLSKSEIRPSHKQFAVNHYFWWKGKRASRETNATFATSLSRAGWPARYGTDEEVRDKRPAKKKAGSPKPKGKGRPRDVDRLPGLEKFVLDYRDEATTREIMQAVREKFTDPPGLTTIRKIRKGEYRA